MYVTTLLGYHHHYHHKSHRCMLIAQLNQYWCMWNNDIHHLSHLITDIYRIRFKVITISIVFQYCGDAVYANATKEVNTISLILYCVKFYNVSFNCNVALKQTMIEQNLETVYATIWSAGPGQYLHWICTWETEFQIFFFKWCMWGMRNGIDVT